MSASQKDQEESETQIELNGSTTDPTTFDYAISQIDDANRRAWKRARAQEIESHNLTRLPPGESYPWSAPEDTLEAAVVAVSRATGRAAPPLRLDSNPDEIYCWVANAILAFGAEQREEGREMERASIGLPFSRRNAERAFELMTTLNELLTNRR